MATIRPAGIEDASILSIIRQKAWDSAYRGIYPDEVIDDFDYETHTARFLRQINAENVWVYAIVEDDTLVGFTVIGMAIPAVYRDITVCLHSLYLLPKYQGKGIGKSVMEFVRNWCKEKGVFRFYNSCNPHNRRAMAFYYAMGGIIGLRDACNDSPAEDQVYFEYTVE